jgi:Cu(I)/Ag(I) efflux system membrane protein CusA/SilA
MGQYIPLGQLTRIRLKPGPPLIKSENGLLVSYVPVDLAPGVSLGEYVTRADRAIKMAQERGELKMPAGTYYKWSGQYEFMQRVKARMTMIIPTVLIIIFILLYFALRSPIHAMIAMLSLPFALTGGIWYMFLLNHDLSVAVILGFIALAGLASETIVIMYIYLELAYRQRRPTSPGELNEAIIEGAVMRVRPKLMTVCTTMLGLLPIMFASGAGSAAMQRLAAPMIGGLVSSALLTLFIIPVLYGIYKGFHIKEA